MFQSCHNVSLVLDYIIFLKIFILIIAIKSIEIFNKGIIRDINSIQESNDVISLRKEFKSEDREERKRILERFERGELTMYCNEIDKVNDFLKDQLWMDFEMCNINRGKLELHGFLDEAENDKIIIIFE